MWFFSAKAGCLAAWECFVTNHVIPSVHRTVQVKTAASPAVTLTLNGPPNMVSERLKPYVLKVLHCQYLRENTSPCVLQTRYCGTLLGNKTSNFDWLMCTSDVVIAIFKFMVFVIVVGTPGNRSWLLYTQCTGHVKTIIYKSIYPRSITCINGWMQNPYLNSARNSCASLAPVESVMAKQKQCCKSTTLFTTLFTEVLNINY